MNSTPENLPKDVDGPNSESEQAGSLSAASSLPDGRISESPVGVEQGVEVPVPELVSESSSPLELVAWGLKHFASQKKIITTSFGMEGCTLIDMCSKAIAADPTGDSKLTVAWIDTGFFFPETHALSLIHI